ncbi:MAG: sugar phosphate isomerase/epimerase family protein [Promethearchaeota archaeon]
MIPLSLNQNSYKDLALFDFIKVSNEFHGVELNYDSIGKFTSNNGTLKDLKEELEIYNLKLTSIFSLEDFSLCSETSFKKKILPIFNKMIKFCYRLESNLLVVQPSFLKNSFENTQFLQLKIIKRTRKRLAQLGAIAFDEDILLGFEFINNSSVQHLSETIQIVKPLESKENIGCIVDLFWLFKSQEQYSDLIEIKNQIFLIQLCDIKIDAMDDPKRLIPGKGEFKFNQFFNFLRRNRIKTDFSLEIIENECSKTCLKKIIQYFKNIS